MQFAQECWIKNRFSNVASNLPQKNSYSPSFFQQVNFIWLKTNKESFILLFVTLLLHHKPTSPNTPKSRR